MNIKNICFTGTGYVGGPDMPVIAKQCPNIKVTIVDINATRITAWNFDDLDELPFFEPGLSDIVKDARDKKLFFFTDIENNIDEAEIKQ